MRILIDLQSAQAGPALDLARSIIEKFRGHTVNLAVCDAQPADLVTLRAAFTELLAPWDIHPWFSGQFTDDKRAPEPWHQKVHALIKTAQWKRLRPDVVLSIRPTTEGRHEADLASDEQLMSAFPTITKFVSEVESLFSESDIVGLLDECRALAKRQPAREKEVSGDRPKLAFVSPLPPERSGIADYGAELLPALAKFYDVDVILDQATISNPWIHAHCGIVSSQDFLQVAARYERVLYHFGNSSYHKHMFHLLAKVPGVVVLHDFYLGDILNFLELHQLAPHAFSQALYHSHGYASLLERHQTEHVGPAVRSFPANLTILEQAQGVIVHSAHSQQLARHWYGEQFGRDWHVIPLLREPATAMDRMMSRKVLGLDPEAFVVCSFGLIGPNKLNHRLLTAWLGSELSQNPDCQLIFVGEEVKDGYGENLRTIFTKHENGKGVSISGWVETDDFRHYLAATDLAVQLRANSRGETSAAVLDCMNHGIATIANAHGAFAELPDDGVYKLAESFTDGDLSRALETLWRNDDQREKLGRRARQVIAQDHAPDVCARRYAAAIESSVQRAQIPQSRLIQTIADTIDQPPSDTVLLALARAVSRATTLAGARRKLLVDVSSTHINDLKTGIQRVVRALVRELIAAPPEGYRVEPVYLSDEGGHWHYRYARAWTSRALGIPKGWMDDDPIESSPGDHLLVADFTGGIAVEAERAGLFSLLKSDGVTIHFCVYDLLPIQLPHCFPPDQFGFLDWIRTTVRSADTAICISRAVASDLQRWIDTAAVGRPNPLKIEWFHLGADIGSSIPTKGMPEDAAKVLGRIRSDPSFLMVGTIEPRKGHLQTVDAFSSLWKQGLDINLVIIGREGWGNLPDKQRRTIPQIVSTLRLHPEFGARLIWMEDVSDEFLESIYAASACLIAASEGEGFGLPLIEAAQKRVPIIARDIPIFREVAGKHAHYFEGAEPDHLACAVQEWLALANKNEAPSSSELHWLTWQQSARMLTERMGISGRRSTTR